MNIICKRTGLPVRARGLVQITECWYPDVTDEEAEDPVFALNMMISMIRDKEVCINQWTTCYNYYNM